MARRHTLLVIGLGIFVLIAQGFAQSKKDPLTDKQIEEVREAGDQPVERIKLFVGYTDDRATELEGLYKERHAQNREVRTHDLLDEFTRLADDLQDNLDAYNQDHNDLRKALKVLTEKSAHWTTVLNGLPVNSEYDFVRKSAVDANQGVHDAATQMLAEQETYFAEKKKADKEAEKKAERESETR